MDIIAVRTLRLGRKPCYSVLNITGVYERKRYTNIFINNLYHTLVTLIGRKFLGRDVSLPGFGIAVSSVSIKGPSIPVDNTPFKISTNYYLKSACYVIVFNTLAFSPKTPVATRGRSSLTALDSSSYVIGRDNASDVSSSNGLKCDRMVAGKGVVTTGTLKTD